MVQRLRTATWVLCFGAALQLLGALTVFAGGSQRGTSIGDMNHPDVGGALLAAFGVFAGVAAWHLASGRTRSGAKIGLATAVAMFASALILGTGPSGVFSELAIFLWLAWLLLPGTRAELVTAT